MRSCIVSEASNDVKQLPSLALTICLGVFGQASQSTWCRDEISRPKHARETRPPLETTGQCLTTEDSSRTIDFVMHASSCQYDQSRMPATDVSKGECRPGELCTTSSDWARVSRLPLKKRILVIHREMGSPSEGTHLTNNYRSKRLRKDEAPTSSDHMLSGTAHLDQSALQPEQQCFHNRTLRRNKSYIDTKHVLKTTRSPLEVETSKAVSTALSIVSGTGLRLQQKSDPLIWVHSQDTTVLSQNGASTTDAVLDMTSKRGVEPSAETLSPINEKTLAVTAARDFLLDKTNASTRESTSLLKELLKEQAMEPTLDRGSLSTECDVGKTRQQQTTAISSHEPMIEPNSSFGLAQTVAGRSPEIESILQYLTSSINSPNLKASLTKLEDFVETLRECKPRFEPLTYEDSDQKMVDATLRHFEYLVKFCLKKGQGNSLSIKLVRPGVTYNDRRAENLAKKVALLTMMVEAHVRRARNGHEYPEIQYILQDCPEYKEILFENYIRLAGITCANIDLLKRKFVDSPAPFLFFCAWLRSRQMDHAPGCQWLEDANKECEREGIQTVIKKEWHAADYCLDRCMDELKNLFSPPSEEVCGISKKVYDFLAA